MGILEKKRLMVASISKSSYASNTPACLTDWQQHQGDLGGVWGREVFPNSLLLDISHGQIIPLILWRTG